MKIIIDFDGTLTAEEKQARSLAMKSLDTLADEIIGAPRKELEDAYEVTKARILRAPHAYWWEVNGLVAAYADEGAFILNTTTLQHMLAENEGYSLAVETAYPSAQYGPLVDCTNDLFHRHTAEFQPAFRPGAREVLLELAQQPDRAPIVLTNSLGDKVQWQLTTLALDAPIPVLGDTRQYDMAPDWQRRFSHAMLGKIQIWPISELHQIDLRRPDYYRALHKAKRSGEQFVVVADTFSMPGALPLMMGIPFFLLRTPYTPAWCADAVNGHPLGHILEDLTDLPTALDRLPYPGNP